MSSLFSYKPVTECSASSPISGTVKLLPVARQSYGKVLPFAFESGAVAAREFAFGAVGRSETAFSSELTALLRAREGGVSAQWTADPDDSFGFVTVDALDEWQSVPAEKNSRSSSVNSINLSPRNYWRVR